MPNNRNDSLLNTGMSSAINRRLELEREKKKELTRSRNAKIIPGAQFIADAVKAEKARVTNIENLILNVSTEENVRAQLLAIQMHIDWLDGLSLRYGKLVRAQAKEAKEHQEAANG